MEFYYTLNTLNCIKTFNLVKNQLNCPLTSKTKFSCKK